LICIALLLLNAQTVSNGFWYDADKPHTLALTQPGISLGICGERWHLDYVRSGTFRSDAIALAGDAPNLARYVGHGRYDGVEALWDWRHATIGALLYVPRWEEHTLERGIAGTWKNQSNLHIAPVVGVRWGPVSLTETFMCISDRCESGIYPPIWRNLTTLTLTWRFHD
jgi:hypothetical protein